VKAITPKPMKTKIKSLTVVLACMVLVFLCGKAGAFYPRKSGCIFDFPSCIPHTHAPCGDASHQSITEIAIAQFAAANPSLFGSRHPSQRAINDIVDANAKVDDLCFRGGEACVKEAHFDSESFAGGQQRLFDLLDRIRQGLNANNLSGARRALGQAFHTIQDFYSHSNWVETMVDIYPDLGRPPSPTPRPSLTVAPGATCNDCGTADGCPDNLITPPPGWTSGYFSTIPFATKPTGKCSHGDCFDRTKGVLPRGGINKDTSNSPHGTRHFAAAGRAILASKRFLTNLQADAQITPEQLITLLCGPTLAICIDTTGSMGPIIDAVKNSAIAIVNRRLGTDEEPGEYVLAPFNDPDVPEPIVTSDPDVFKSAISSLSADGGGDCPELAWTGAFKGISRASSSGSLFLYTDADAKDASRETAVRDLAGNKKIRGFCQIFRSNCESSPNGQGDSESAAMQSNNPKNGRHTSSTTAAVASPEVDPSYQQFAEGTGGQVFSLDASEAGQITTLLDDVSRSNAVNLLSIQDTLGPDPSVYHVPIDNTLSAVTFSVSGDTSVTLNRPDGSVVQDGDPGVTITNLSTAHLFSIANPQTGAWQISVSGSGAFSIIVTGEATLDIKSFDFVYDGGDQSHEPGLFPIDGFPVAGQTNIVSGELTDGFSSARFEFRSPAGAVLQTLVLQQGTENAANVFVGSLTPPNTPFVVYATGQTNSGANFQRLLPGTIMPQSVTVTALAPANLVPGTSTSYTFQVHNLGSADTFLIEASDDKGFLASITPTNVSLARNETKDVTVVLQTPANAIIGTSDTLTVTATGGLGAHNFAVVVSDVVIAPHLGNISTRSFVQTGDNVMIGGFIVQGTTPKRVIIRAIGPELGAPPYNVPNALADPTLELHNGTGALIASNDNWQHTIIGGIITASQVTDIQNSGLPPGDSRESAIIADLPAGNYTAIVRGVSNTTGVALVEVYDLSPDNGSILRNISTRAFVQTGDNVMIGGFIVKGTTPKSVIVRAIGPELGAPPYNVPNALADPTLELHDGTGALIASNDNWLHTIIGGIITTDQSRDIVNSGYAPGDGRESAIIADLLPGNYTAIVRGVSNTTGVALVEVYDFTSSTPSATPTPTPTPTPVPTSTPTPTPTPTATPSCIFDGSYTGSYSGSFSGPVAFTVSNCNITVTQPISGSGTVNHSGGASFGGGGGGGIEYAFTGQFSLQPDGSVETSGDWTATSPGGTGSGTWNASRPSPGP
jgi:hypothetical protein